MARYIDVDEIKTRFNSNTWQIEFVIKITENAAPVVYSKWKTSYFEDGYKVNMTCLNCGGHFSADYNDAKCYNYCPNCGARMANKK